MNQRDAQQRSGISYPSTESDSVKASHTKKRKSRKFGGALRKFFGRKNVKSQISLPTPTRQLENVDFTYPLVQIMQTNSHKGPMEFITSATSTTDPRFQRAISLPVGEHISRHGALGSHAPLTNLSNGQVSAEPQIKIERRSRRATLPNIIGAAPEHLSDRGHAEARESFIGDGDGISTSNIGFAITSGSNPKRRSRSADAFYDAAKAHRMSPIQWRQHRRRSDEIRYWRDSIGPMPALDLTAHEDTGTRQEEATADTMVEDHDKELDGEPEPLESDHRGTFDFGMLATSLREQEDVTIPERVVTLEVKLMDLEYAISKLQINAAAAAAAAAAAGTGLSNGQHLQSAVQDHRDAAGSTLHTPAKGRNSPVSATKSQPGSDSTTATSVSTQPTVMSLQPTSPFSNKSSGDPFLEQKQRPTSTATTVRPATEEENPESPTFLERSRLMREKRRKSITSIGIDQFTSLILLIRQEQEARRRLEKEVLQLRNELTALRSPYSPTTREDRNGSSLYRNRKWLSEDEEEGGYRSTVVVRRTPSYDDTSGTEEDGYMDVYETPVEQRRAYEGGYFHGVEGEAF